MASKVSTPQAFVPTAPDYKPTGAAKLMNMVVFNLRTDRRQNDMVGNLARKTLGVVLLTLATASIVGIPLVLLASRQLTIQRQNEVWKKYCTTVKTTAEQNARATAIKEGITAQLPEDVKETLDNTKVFIPNDVLPKLSAKGGLENLTFADAIRDPAFAKGLKGKEMVFAEATVYSAHVEEKARTSGKFILKSDFDSIINQKDGEVQAAQTKLSQALLNADATLQKDLQDTSAKLVAAQSDVTDLAAKLATAEQNLQNLTISSQNEKAALELDVQNLTTQLANAQAALTNAAQDKAALAQQINQLTTELTDAKQKLIDDAAAAQLVADGLNKQVTQLTTELTDAKQKLIDDAAAAQLVADGLNKQITQLTTELTDAKQKLIDDAAAAQLVADGLNKQITQLTTELTDAKQKLIDDAAAAQLVADGLNKQITQLTTELTDAKQKLIDDAAAAQLVADGLNKQITQLTTELTDAKQKLIDDAAAAQLVADGLNKQITQLTTELNDAKQKLIDDAAAAQRATDDLNNQVTQLRSELASATKDKADLEKQVQDLKADLQTASANLFNAERDAKREIALRDDTIARLEFEKKTLTTKGDAGLQKINNDLETKQKQLDAEIAQAKSAISALEQQIKDKDLVAQNAQSAFDADKLKLEQEVNALKQAAAQIQTQSAAEVDAYKNDALLSKQQAAYAEQKRLSEESARQAAELQLAQAQTEKQIADDLAAQKQKDLDDAKTDLQNKDAEIARLNALLNAPKPQGGKKNRNQGKNP